MYKTMTFEEWEEEFKPIKNPLDDNASYDGCMFETYGEELETVKKHPINNIWTIVDSDEGKFPVITSGFHLVNRLGYLVTEKPYNDNDLIDVIDED